ncbi:MAG: D-hexose-6-phosphate mutarotase [Acidobacteriota bacterium]
MDLQTLSDHFAIPGVLDFAATNGLIRARVTTSACTAEIYLQGAHLTQWQPIGHEPVLFLSERSHLAPGEAIRGGIPVLFPWFGTRTATASHPRTDGPKHGFARTTPWKLAFAALSGDDLHLTLTLGPSDISRSFGYDHFQVAYELILGRELRLRLTVANQAETPLNFEEALHTYFAVGDIRTVSLTGLEGAEYLDKVEGFTRKRQIQPAVTFSAETDCLYLNTATTVTIDDSALHRRIHVAKTNSQNTVVWNPWSALTATLADMDPDAWLRMLCVETVNASENKLTLAPQQAHTMEAHITVEATTEPQR